MIAFLFPGQGSQYAGMGRDFHAEFEAARRTFEEASDSIGIDVAELCFEGDPQTLSLTANAQPAILAASVAVLRVVSEETDLAADMLAGHSLGEFTALVASGCMEFPDAVRAVRKRGEFMQEAVPAGVGKMAAVLGIPSAEVEAACARVSGEGNVVSPANFNSPSQTVISGHAGAVDAASALAAEKGAKRVVPLSVSAPFHCELMEPAAEGLRSVLSEMDFSPMNLARGHQHAGPGEFRRGAGGGNSVRAGHESRQVGRIARVHEGFWSRGVRRDRPLERSLRSRQENSRQGRRLREH